MDHRLAERRKWLAELQTWIPKGSAQLEQETLEKWAKMLVKVSPRQLVLAVPVLVERHAFFPALAEILAACREVKSDWEDREWKKKLGEWEQEAIGPGEARKLLADVVDKAGNKILGFQKVGGFSRFGRR